MNVITGGRCGTGMVFTVLMAAIGLVALTLTGCKRESEPAANGERPLRVVCTTGMVADIVKRVGAERIEVETLMGPGVDPHLYKATPGDLRALGDADLVFYSGLHLEGRLAEVLEKLGERKPSIAVAEVIPHELLRSPLGHSGTFDPHVWFDVSLWLRTIEPVLSTLTKADPASAENFAARAVLLREELQALHIETREAIASILPSRRVLVTAHDAFGYFGAAYGIEVLAIQGISTESEASLADVNALVEMLVTRKIPAVFVESSVPRKAIDTLIEGARARGHTVALGGELFSDAMGAAKTPDGTYPGMVRHNTRTIVAALAGGAP